MGNINASVDLRRDGNVAVVTVDNPPVNALKHEVRAGLAEALRQTRRRSDGVAAVVIACAGRTFFAGADITEFGKPLQAAEPRRGHRRYRGDAEAGDRGLARHRAGRRVRIGARLPFPRCRGDGARRPARGQARPVAGRRRDAAPAAPVGPEKALQMIVTGEPIGAAQALADGIVDQIVEGDLTAAAIGFARSWSRPNAAVCGTCATATTSSQRRTDPSPLTRRGGGADPAAARPRCARRPASRRCAPPSSLPFDEGLRRESELFQPTRRRRPVQGAAPCLFRRARGGEDPGPARRDRGRGPIAGAAVIGAGTMGGGIAMCFANAGIPVTLIETTHGFAAERASTGSPPITAPRSRGAGSAPTTWNAHGADHRRRRARCGRRGRCRDRGGVRGDGAEEAGVRRARPSRQARRDARHQHLDPRRRRDRPRHGPAAGRGRHALLQPGQRHAASWRSCAALESAPDAVATALALARRLGKVPAVVGVCYGFVGNRMLARRSVEAERLLLEGALPQRGRRGARRVRLADGAVRDDGPRRARCRLAHPQERAASRP